ncbi:MAG: hypothetical protein KGJ86_14055, partial [Chloroflexota bacterium]|nr:hypothetical protein [Chloroflexota bacterium]
LGELTLPHVLAGWWGLGRKLADGEPALAQQIPGAALSPDGRAIAVLDCDTRRATLIDAALLSVQRTVTLKAQAGWLDWLPFRAQVAHAKGPARGTDCHVTFSLDGRHLYAYGSKAEIGPDGKPRLNGLGLELLDLGRGTIDARALPGEQLFYVLPSPDGSLYTFGRSATNTAWKLSLLDGSSLKVLAERTVPGYSQYWLTPAS